MISSGILLSTASFNSLSISAQREVLTSIGLSAAQPDSVIAPKSDSELPAHSTEAHGEGPVELTVAMVRKLTDRLSEKTLTALKIIARSETPDFHMKDVIDGTDNARDYMDMRGVWSALTRRTRSITNDSNVDLIWWDSASITDSKGNVIDHLGSIAKMTHQSLRLHFGL